MEEWNGIWKKIFVWNEIWNGRFLVWNENGMEENYQYGIWKNRLPFHSIPCPGENYAINALTDRKLIVSTMQFVKSHLIS